MKITKIKLKDLRRPEKNVRNHTTEQLNEFCRSIKMFGQIRPIVVDENNTILAGNGLYEALTMLKIETADCYVVDSLTENEKKKLMLADNRIFNLGIDDLEAFDAIIAELGEDLDVPGYDEELLQTLAASSDEIDNMVSDYGKIDDDKKQEIIDAKEKNEQGESAQTYEENSGEAYKNAERSAVEEVTANGTEETQEVKKFVVCPKCGEKIWL